MAEWRVRGFHPVFGHHDPVASEHVGDFDPLACVRRGDDTTHTQRIDVFPNRCAPASTNLTNSTTTEKGVAMCRNIKTLFNFDPPASDAEVRAAALQYVRKISGSRQPAKANAEAFEYAVDQVTAISRALLSSLVTQAPPKNREVEAEKRRARFAARQPV